ncbi:hypothetical protein MLD38_036811 [Melastoma candidum]|uniref:Uncharacterized protein n=1 Tax=Melastoma candidum TaxID=119954 RepID=A0ACB9LKV5_9MYRT|nr:hypothetical protein MLD38_036811 [Melastoma candidum]
MLQEVRGLPTSLTVLHASYCPLDKGIPEEIGNLSALEELDLSYTNMRFLPVTVSQLTSLKSLKLNYCRMLQEVRELPTGLTVLDATDYAHSKGIPEEIGSLSALKKLKLLGSKIPFLSATVIQLTSLKSLELVGCNMLQELRGLPTSLTCFEFSWTMVGLFEEISCRKGYAERIIKFRGAFELGSLSRLKTLSLSFPSMGSLETCLEIDNFALMEMEVGGLDSLPSLTTLSIRRSDSLLGVSNIGRLRRGLRSLEFIGCRTLVEIPGLEQLELLEYLRFHLCPSIRGIQDLLELKRLKEVGIIGCSSLLRVPRTIDECHLSIDGRYKLKSFWGSYRDYGRKYVSFDA